MPHSRLDILQGCLLGCAVGDSIGLPYEGLSTRRTRRFARRPLRQRLVLGRGMISDDTDHTIFALQALIVSRGDPEAFRRALAWRLRGWLLCLPAGIGLATLRSIIRLWLGIRRSGVHSAGNGPSMRSAILGAALSDDAGRRRSCVEQSTWLTHTDPKALAGALAIAETAARIAQGEWQARPAADEFIAMLAGVSEDADWRSCVQRMREALQNADPMAAALMYFGTRAGISGYTLHSVPFALLAWYHHHGDYEATVQTIVEAGGDVDTVGAIAGALAGAVGGVDGIPAAWREKLCDWPHSRSYMLALARRCVEPDTPVRTRFPLSLFPRGLLFTLVVLAHGFRRLLPPY